MSARTLNYKARGLAKRKYSSWSPQGKSPRHQRKFNDYNGVFYRKTGK